MALHLDGSVTLYDECCITNYSKNEWCDIKISEDLKYTEADILPNISHNIICVEIEEGLTQIPSYAFMNCIRIKEIIIQDRVESIGKYAFFNCNSLKELKIPETCVSIDETAFKGCFISNSSY